MQDLISRGRDELRHEPVERRVRANLGAEPSPIARGRCSSGSHAASARPTPCRRRTSQPTCRQRLLRTATCAASYCPYKGRASRWSVGRHADLGWTYEQPLPAAVAIAGLVAFWYERVDVFLDSPRH